MATCLSVDIDYGENGQNMGKGYPGISDLLEFIIPKLKINFHKKRALMFWSQLCRPPCLERSQTSSAGNEKHKLKSNHKFSITDLISISVFPFFADNIYLSKPFGGQRSRSQKVHALFF